MFADISQTVCRNRDRAGRTLNENPETVKQGLNGYPPTIPRAVKPWNSNSTAVSSTRTSTLRPPSLASKAVYALLAFVALSLLANSHLTWQSHSLQRQEWHLSAQPLNRVLKLTLAFRRNSMFKHDYAALRNRLMMSGTSCSEMTLFLRHSFIIDHARLVNIVDVPVLKRLMGMGKTAKNRWECSELRDLVVEDVLDMNVTYKYVGHGDLPARDVIKCKVPLPILAGKLKLSVLRDVANAHGGTFNNRSPIASIQEFLSTASCEASHFSYFQQITDLNKKREPKVKPKKQTSRKRSRRIPMLDENAPAPQFPPPATTRELHECIIADFCNAAAPPTLSEAGCAVCGTLTPARDLNPISVVEDCLEVITVPGKGITKQERKSVDDPHCEIEGPILEYGCDSVCQSCCVMLRKGRLPPSALANGNWIGRVPEQLQELTFAEKLLISRVYHSNFVVRVGAGQRKMKANVVLFSKPMPKIYDVLPPPREDLDDVLAFMYIGPTRPTAVEYRKTPFLVRRNKVALALEWLKLNHEDYKDIDISYRNLQQYPEDVPPVVIDYKWAANGTDQPETSAVNETDAEEGVADGECAFTVHGLTGENIVGKNTETLKAMALRHLESGGKVLGIGQSEAPESTFNNPQLYPQVFPWLYPYGLGGMSNLRTQTGVSDAKRKKHLLMHHDKRFQRESMFALMAFNHEQIRSSVKGGYLLTKRKSFASIANRLMNLNKTVLADVTERLKAGEHVIPTSQEEKDCFRVLHDLDHINGHVQGSKTQKKYMRNEIWSLTSYLGAPSWFVTFSPADVKHPIALYFAGGQDEFKPELRYNTDDAYRMISENPVAGARFFNFMVENFIEHVLGVNTDHKGLFGETSGYYGTVEQQGRLTLHLHLLVWIRGSSSPQQIRDKLLDGDSTFQKRMIDYLESCHKGEFTTGLMEDIRADIAESKDPDETMECPAAPPPLCDAAAHDCCTCEQERKSWWGSFAQITDRILFRSNRHSCRVGEASRGCRAQPTDECKARFPREVVKETMVDTTSGAITMKKGEAWLNTFTPTLSYLLRCNHDTTSLLSGTTIKAVIAYVTDYVTKTPLKSHAIFDMVQSVFSRNSEPINGDPGQLEKARKVMVQVVNGLSSKMEIGAPMACLYLLEHPDHYSSHEFETFFWRSYINEIKRVWDPDPEEPETRDDQEEDEGEHDSPIEPARQAQAEAAPETVLLSKRQNKYYALSPLLDYIYRPLDCENMNLYEWISGTEKVQRYKKKATENTDEMGTDEEITDENGDPDDQSCFLAKHPQTKTHRVKVLPLAQRKVPNFVGGTLPRRDQGNRDEYCMTMLGLFKPWRTGRDLKSESDTWDACFTAHEFTTSQTTVMDNFNLKYECNDARDDFSAQRKKNKTRSTAFFFMNDQTIDQLDSERQHDMDEVDEMWGDLGGIEEFEASLADFNPKTRRRQMQGDEIARVLDSSGWLRHSERMIDTEVVDGKEKTPSEWKSLLASRKEEVLQARQDERKTASNDRGENKEHDGKTHVPRSVMNKVKIVDKEYLTEKFECRDDTTRDHIDNTVHNFHLNTEQERAFRIVANHAVTETEDQLLMYLGGMAGTGKSQVIKALMHFFTVRKETYRFMTMAPTGSAAALISGSTYHSILGINEFKPGDSVSSLTKVRTKLDKTDLILLDEISMVDCESLYNISAQLCLAMDVKDKPFGGMNIILAGDFAQLPPPGGKPPLYSETVGTTLHKTNSHRIQKATLGKALWHQFTTCVILRENMRQKQQSSEDTKFRTMLENLRYKACTAEDIEFLTTRIAGRNPTSPVVSHPNFRDVSVITSFNVHRDKINELGKLRFAAETGQELKTFYSRDTWKGVDDTDRTVKIRRKKKVIDPLRTSDDITMALQSAVWNVPPALTENHPGKLELCLGMPIMIKRNEATECCVTNGAEGTIAGWKSVKLGEKYDVLQTVFVKLTNPPTTVQLEGLPQNVVPVSKQSVDIRCELPNGTVLSIARDQVPIIGNFAMTDFASQGRTRPYNVVDPHNCRGHQSLYTCLSRSATADGTLLIQGFDRRKMTGGMSGYLRQEFRSLEILDEITCLQYAGTLPSEITGTTRNSLIHAYRSWKGGAYVPANVDNNLAWDGKKSFQMQPAEETSRWEILTKSKGKATPAGTKRARLEADSDRPRKQMKIDNIFKTEKPRTGLKRKPADNLEGAPTKRGRANTEHMSRNEPGGFRWVRNSCAYDSMFTILRLIWDERRLLWGEVRTQNNLMALIHDEFAAADAGQKSWDESRDALRIKFQEHDGETYRLYAGTDVLEMSTQLSRLNNSGVTASTLCHSCGNRRNETVVKESITAIDEGRDKTILECLRKRWTRSRGSICITCSTRENSDITFRTVPPLMFVQAATNTQAKYSIESELAITTAEGNNVNMKLAGIIYYGSNHFTARLLRNSGEVWGYDGMRDGGRPWRLTETNREWNTLNGKKASVLIYYRID